MKNYQAGDILEGSIPVSTWSISMISKSVSRVVPLPNGHSRLLNGGDPNHFIYKSWEPILQVHPGRLTWTIIMEVWFRSFSFLFMGDL